MINNNCLVSIIIPVHNTEEFLGECLDSVMSQTYNNIEVIIINDNSVDNSKSIIDKYKNTYNNILYYEVSFNNAALTRDFGVKKSRGDYICFVDSDDIVNCNYVEVLHKALVDTDSLISTGKITSFRDNINIINFNVDKCLFSTEDNILDYFFYNYHSSENSRYVSQSMVAKMFDRKLFKNIDYTVIKTSILEDNFIISQILNKIDPFKIAMIDKGIYYYRSNPNSTMGSVLDNYIHIDGVIVSYIGLFNNTMLFLKKLFSKYENIDNYINHIKSEEYYSLAQQLFSKSMSEKDLNINLNKLLEDSVSDNLELKSIINSKDRILNDILNSRSYKLSRLISNFFINRYIKMIIDKSIKIMKKNWIFSFIGVNNEKNKIKKHTKNSDYAIILHLFYGDVWKDKIEKKLMDLYDISAFDLYVNIPESADDSLVEMVRQSFSDACIVRLPNRGRDVLPFALIFNNIRDKKYSAILKIHSKASLHTEGGSSWMDEMLLGLIPNNKKELDIIIKTLKKNKTLVGLKTVYISIYTYLSKNLVNIEKLLNCKFDKLSDTDLGFFAGTMFWISGEYKYLDYIKYNMFEKESGQTDGTYAHAVERFISIKPQIEGDKVFYLDNEHNVLEADNGKLEKVDEINNWGEFIKNAKK